MRRQLIWSSTGMRPSPEFMVKPNLSSTFTVAAGHERGFETATGVSHGDFIWHVSERGLAFGTGFGSGVSLVVVVATTLVVAVGVGVTTVAASSSVAASSGLRGSSEKDTVTG